MKVRRETEGILPICECLGVKRIEELACELIERNDVFAGIWLRYEKMMHVGIGSLISQQRVMARLLKVPIKGENGYEHYT